LGNPIIATALNAVGTASDIAELNTVLNNPNLSLAEKILRSTNAVLGLATNAVDAAELARRIRIGDLGLELAILPAVGHKALDLRNLGKGTISADYAKLQSDLRLTNEATDLLQRGLVSPEAIRALSVKDKLAPEYAAYIVLDHGNVREVQSFVELAAAKNVTLETAEQVLKNAKNVANRGGIGSQGLLPEVNDLVSPSSKGNLRNPDAVPNLVREAEEQVRKQGFSGFTKEIQDAASYVARGDDIELSTGADIINFTTKEAIQSKEIFGSSIGAIEERLREGAVQLSGVRGEVPLPGFTRTIDVRINSQFGSNNPYFNQSDPAAIQTFIRDILNVAADSLGDNLPKTQFLFFYVDRVRFTNNQGTWVFEATNLRP
jgi:hypothetical protein